MCGAEGEAGPSHKRPLPTFAQSDTPPNWETISLPHDAILRRLTDAHCHPTDLEHHGSVYDEVKLGGLAAMATEPENQDLVNVLGGKRRWNSSPKSDQRGERKGPRVVSCFGYHPWFSHRYTLTSPPPDKATHYSELFFTEATLAELKEKPESVPKKLEQYNLLMALLPYLPEPTPFDPLLQGMREDIRRCQEQGRLVMVGEIGLDGGCRVRCPKRAKGVYDRWNAGDLSATGSQAQPLEATELPTAGDDGNTSPSQNDDAEALNWQALTPFKVSMKHQVAIAQAQLELAIEFGINVSFHSVSAPGPTVSLLTAMRDKHRTRFTNSVNVDIHSAGGWSPEFWSQAERNLLNIYASPSIFITGRSPTAPQLIRAISSERMLVESDSHDVRLSTKLVWAATVWIANCKGWSLEGGDGRHGTTPSHIPDGKSVGRDEPGMVADGGQGDEDDIGGQIDTDEPTDADSEEYDQYGKPKEKAIWTVRQLERNWNRFMGLTT